MAKKKSKLSTPDWIREGYDSPEEYAKAKGIDNKKKSGKTFKIKKCPECGSEDVGVVLGGGEGKGSKGWECHKCLWKGHETDEIELSEEEFMKYLDRKDAREEKNGK